MTEQIRDTTQLLQLIAEGYQPDFLYFWGHTSRAGHVDKTCLSQWYPTPFFLAGVTYHTAEHYMMAQKALLFGEPDIAASIVANPDPKQAKQFGRQIKGFDQATWEAACEQIVFEGNLGKFSQNDELREYLLSTNDQVLVEASPVDPVWGIGLAENEARNLSPSDWKGRNLLGYALMRVRTRLRMSDNVVSA